MSNKVLLAVLACAFSGAVFAGSATYKALDEDKNGLINPDEAEAMPILVEQWTEIDVNEDGKIDAVEFSRFESLSAPSGAAGGMEEESVGHTGSGKGYMRE